MTDPLGTAEPPPGPPPAYGSFGARLRAVIIDSIVVGLGLIAIIVFAMVTESVPGSGRIAAAALFALVLLYEPVMVSRTGGTVGHRRANLRVVHEATGGNPGFLRALARFVIKSTLGFISFVTMALTRRHQAVHDALTGTTVRIRDLAAAREEDIRWERDATPPAGRQPRGRRLVLIVAYVVASFVALAIALNAMLSAACMVNDLCSPGEQVLSTAMGLAWVGACAWLIIAGWRGRLWGCRTRPAPPDTGDVDTGASTP